MKHRTTEERFWSKVNKDGPVPPHKPELGPCWVWTGATSGGGYGKMGWEGRKTVDAHRIAFYFEHGRWPAPCALHKCDNKPCVRASHLFEGTKLDNRKDCAAKDRHNRGIRNGSAKLTDEHVRCVRASNASTATLAAFYGVSLATINDARRGRYWRHVKPE